MFDLYAASLIRERALVLERAEGRGPLLEAARPPSPVPAVVRAGQVVRHWSNLARAVRPLRWVLRPTHA